MRQMPSDLPAEASAQAGASLGRQVSSQRSLGVRDFNSLCRKDLSTMFITGTLSGGDPKIVWRPRICQELGTLTASPHDGHENSIMASFPLDSTQTKD